MLIIISVLTTHKTTLYKQFTQHSFTTSVIFRPSFAILPPFQHPPALLHYPPLRLPCSPMLTLQNISLFQFKNYTDSRFLFTEKIVGICGKNGLGKTNLLDAVYLACFSKSYFSNTDAAMVHSGLQGMRVDAGFVKNGRPENVVCIIRENGKKELSRNNEPINRFSHHIGHFPAVIIAPDDIALITGPSEVRRKMIDILLSQVNPRYINLLIQYNKILQQRNSLLKASAERGFVDKELLGVFTEQLLPPGRELFAFRQSFLADFLPRVANKYCQIAGSNEQPLLTYYSPLLQNDFGSLLNIYMQKDILLRRTTLGIHKDDIEINMHNEPFKTFASQGQRKSLLFALKLCEFEVLKQSKDFAPLLLLDDIFEKLDEDRMGNLLQQVCIQNNGQVLITDTHKERLQLSLKALGVPFQLIELE